MPMHLLAYAGSVTAATSPVTLPGLVDPVVTRSQTSGLYILQQRLQAIAGLGMSAGMARVQLSSPTLRQINIPYFRPINVGALPNANGQVCWMGDQPLMLPAMEELGPLFTTVTALAEDAFFLLWVADSVTPVPPGPILTARATATFTAVAGQWTLGNFTMEQALPTGSYALVGSECISTTGIAHRFAIFNQVFRPGSLSHQAAGDLTDMRLLSRRLGTYGTFNNTSIPQIEVLCGAADTAHEIYLHLVPTSGQIAA